MNCLQQHVASNRVDRLLVRLVYARNRWYGYPIRLLLYFIGIDIPQAVKIGKGLLLLHSPCGGPVIHWNTEIGDDVTIAHKTAIGRADPWVPTSPGFETKIIIGDGAFIGTGAAVMAKAGRPLVVGAGSVVAANSVLTRSTGEREIWAGIPAVKVSEI